MFGPDLVVEIAEGSEDFWHWYASTIRLDRPFRLSPVPHVPPYPPPARGTALWFSGGVESSYTLERLRDAAPTILRIEDFPVFFGEDRRIGQIHFLCAAVAAGLGFGATYLGVERNDLALARNATARQYLERTPAFLEGWSRYQPEHPLRSACSHLHKEEIIAWLRERAIPITGTCDRLRGGRWCGDCYKCFEAFYTAKAVGIDLGIPLTRRAFERFHGEYRRYVESGFMDNFNNAYQHYVRLQITYHLKFDFDCDCRA